MTDAPPWLAMNGIPETAELPDGATGVAFARSRWGRTFYVPINATGQPFRFVAADSAPLPPGQYAPLPVGHDPYTSFGIVAWDKSWRLVPAHSLWPTWWFDMIVESAPGFPEGARG